MITIFKSMHGSPNTLDPYLQERDTARQRRDNLERLYRQESRNAKSQAKENANLRAHIQVGAQAPPLVGLKLAQGFTGIGHSIAPTALSRCYGIHHHTWHCTTLDKRQ